MQAVDALTVSVVVYNSSDMFSTRPPHIVSELRVLISAGMRVTRLILWRLAHSSPSGRFSHRTHASSPRPGSRTGASISERLRRRGDHSQRLAHAAKQGRVVPLQVEDSEKPAYAEELPHRQDARLLFPAAYPAVCPAKNSANMAGHCRSDFWTRDLRGAPASSKIIFIAAG
jgi:hypothetical protein